MKLMNGHGRCPDLAACHQAGHEGPTCHCWCPYRELNFLGDEHRRTLAWEKSLLGRIWPQSFLGGGVGQRVPVTMFRVISARDGDFQQSLQLRNIGKG